MRSKQQRVEMWPIVNVHIEHVKSIAGIAVTPTPVPARGALRAPTANNAVAAETSIRRKFRSSSRRARLFVSRSCRAERTLDARSGARVLAKFPCNSEKRHELADHASGMRARDSRSVSRVTIEQNTKAHGLRFPG